jgi:glycosyltransferase involved in cell wall biosynthesis
MIHDSLISICIPTRNNADYLEGCLNSLLPQVKPYNIPVYVSDNASTDNTIEILSSFKKEHYQLLYFRSNDENLGFDQNLINAVKMASSKYVWPIGDRRRLLPNSMRRVYNFLSKNDLDLLILSVAKYLKSVQNKRYTSARDVFLELWSNVGTLHSCISPTKAWRSEIPENYVGTGWIHFAVVFEFLASLKTVDVMFTGWPSIASCGKSHWRLNFFQVWTNWKNVINALPDVYSSHDKESIIRAWSTHFSILGWGGLLYLRSKGVYNANVYNAYCKDFLEYTNIPLVGAKVVSQLPVLFVKPYPILQRALLKGLRFMRIRYPLNPFKARALLRLVDNYYTEEKEVMQSFLIEVEHNTGLATYGEKEVRRALEEGAVRTLLLSEGLKSLRVFAKCNICSYEEQQTLENQLPTRLEQNVVRKHCPKCRTGYLGITEIRVLTESLAELAEQSSTEVKIVSVKTKEGQMLKNSFKGVAAILRPKPQESLQRMS